MTNILTYSQKEVIMARPIGSKDRAKRKKREDVIKNNIAEYSPVTAIKRLNKADDEKKLGIKRIIGESLQYWGRKCPLSNEEVAEILNDYFAQCYDTGQIPTVEDMCLSLGITRQTLHRWEHGIQCDSERTIMIQQAKEVLAAIDAKLVTEGKLIPVTYIFRAKNYFGMKDQREEVSVRINPLGDNISNAQLEKKYLENANVIELPEIKIEKVESEES